ncbi:hypothetical protein A2833_00245 [Candidatus Azambacteria bacterium RIFCSPHIGHO2_01_FULL_44_55]|uniref:Uncharacterized protein n=1 Tax=Candidatus Azambacteria bacterium RIFCSPLOWO2_02_FULL_44_14 TaxID=1797306 RepID=A0A1F5CBG3_9BACT|nr:MAG: hypothetical protein A3I30_03015 [Candidatus Azambacteria bacterium RIFCSPLOWO2_02_FULL_44_14]OGD41604.1 MAG: hypothetical protein A2833_00245 [Candidatus Azambacteria bacterium RIFCSPHIGHO2_01_FULL_44_55]
MYHNAGRKTRNVRRNLAKQRKQEERANRSSGRTEKGQARADRRVSVIMATGVERDLAAAEWRLKASEEPTLDQQIAGTIAEMFGGAALAQFKSEKAEATAHASA